jgi:hypothetical protein
MAPGDSHPPYRVARGGFVAALDGVEHLGEHVGRCAAVGHEASQGGGDARQQPVAGHLTEPRDDRVVARLLRVFQAAELGSAGPPGCKPGDLCLDGGKALRQLAREPASASGVREQGVGDRRIEDVPR